MKSLILYSLAIVACLQALPRRASADCEPNYSVREHLRANAVKTIQNMKGEGDVLFQEPSYTEDLVKKAIFDYLVDQFNYDSAMRAQAKPDIGEIENNGHNGELDGPEIFTKDGLYCLHITAKKSNLQLTELKTVGNKQYWLAVIHFTDGYHGGETDVFFKYKLETSISVMPVDRSFASTGRLYTLNVVKYPLLVKVEDIDNN